MGRRPKIKGPLAWACRECGQASQMPCRDTAGNVLPATHEVRKFSWRLTNGWKPGDDVGAAVGRNRRETKPRRSGIGGQWNNKVYGK